MEDSVTVLQPTCDGRPWHARPALCGSSPVANTKSRVYVRRSIEPDIETLQKAVRTVGFPVCDRRHPMRCKIYYIFGAVFDLTKLIEQREFVPSLYDSMPDFAFTRRYETSRCSTSYCRRYDDSALPRFRTGCGQDLSHRHAHCRAADTAHGGYRKDACGRTCDARFQPRTKSSL